MIEKLQAQAAPDFTMTDSVGRTVSLSGYQGSKNVMLVFNRGFF